MLAVYTCTAKSVTSHAPFPDIPCPRDPCLALSQFADNYTISNEINIISLDLILLPGNHSLDQELYVSHVDYLSMTKDTQSNETAVMECDSTFGRFHINEMMFISVRGLHFIGCVSNKVRKVEEFTIEDSDDLSGL